MPELPGCEGVRRWRTVTLTLDNAEESARRMPDSFDLPSRERRESLCVGDVVKLMVVVKQERKSSISAAARATVSAVGESAYEAVLNETLLTYKRVKQGDTVTFLAQHVFAIETP